MFKNMSKLKNKSQFLKGFSLIELLLVLGILTILFSITILSFNNEGGSEALSSTTVSLMSVLNGARSQAISSKDAANDSIGYGVRIFSNKIISFEGSYGTKNKELDFSNLVKISTSTGIGTDIIFNNLTGNTSASGTITITVVISSPAKYNTINVYSTGDIEKN
jgi:prepilin-type N-terminal cleavage/methylation domain-containing protein